MMRWFPVILNFTVFLAGDSGLLTYPVLTTDVKNVPERIKKSLKTLNKKRWP